MLDSTFIRENPDVIKTAAKEKGVDFDVDRFLELDRRRRELQRRVDEYRHARNLASDKIAHASRSDKEELIVQMQRKKEEGGKLEEELQQLERAHQKMLLHVPNVYSDDTPVGGEEANREIARWGTPREFSFPMRDHIELGEALDGLDLKRGAKVSGFRGYFLKNELAILHWAVLWHAFLRMREKGFEVMSPPTLLKEFALIGSGHFPGDRQEIYEVEEYGGKDRKETKFLGGTSEPSLLAYRADEIIDESELPLKYCGLSACYRREVGGYGKDAKGLYRIHEFMKTEQVVICRNDLSESLQHFEQIKENALELLRELELPHRIIQIATGDMGIGKYKMYDIETWMPSRGAYGETHSNSHLTDWQARRLNLRYRKADGTIAYPHTMNNTVIASPRILIAIMENFQQADSSILVPKALRPYCGFERIMKHGT